MQAPANLLLYRCLGAPGGGAPSNSTGGGVPSVPPPWLRPCAVVSCWSLENTKHRLFEIFMNFIIKVIC